jgi:diguanylate cyclase (GGDEF)-like protein/PAS domain S-box-containing protein
MRKGTRQAPPRLDPAATRQTPQVDEIVDPHHDEHLDASSLEKALGAMLVRHPEAPIAALEPTGVLVPMPDSIELQRNRVLRARSGLDLIVRRDRFEVLSTWDRILAVGVGRCRVHLADAPETPVIFHGFDLRERHGVIVAVYVPTDASDIRAGADRAAEIGSSLPRFANVRKDDRSFITKTDVAITQILGWSREEMEGRRSIEFIHRDDHALAIDNWMEMLAHPGPARRVRLRHRRRDGAWVWFEITNHNLLEDPDHRCVVSEMVDISEEMAAHEALSAREQLLDRLAETLPIGIFQTNAEHQVVYTNTRLHDILGVGRADTAEAQLATVLEPERPEVTRALDRVLESGLDADLEVKLRLPHNGELRFCTINLRTLRHDDGTVSGAIACVTDVTDGVHMREELEKRATLDELTGCYNRGSIMLALEADIASGGREADRAVIFVDLDRFKEVNDLHGHAIGDDLLRHVAKQLRGSLRREDRIGRIGGDEFLVICPGIGSRDRAMKLAQRLASKVRASRFPKRDVRHLISVGVAWSSGNEVDADTLVAQADRAMYASKDERAGQPKFAA